MRGLAPFLLLLLASCARVDMDIWRAKMGENMADVVRGRDRGYWGYRQMIEDATLRESGFVRYQYKEPAHVSSYLVTRAIRGLGGTAWPNADYTAGCVDRLLVVLRYDPTPSVRAEACSQLGRVAERLGVAPDDPYPLRAQDDAAIQQVASDLFKMQEQLDGGERIAQSLVVESLEAMHKLNPSRLLFAMSMMRALSSRPVANAPDGPIRDAVEKLTPAMCRRAIAIALSDTACGSLVHPRVVADESAAVRMRALEVLNMLRDPVARDIAARRAWDEFYPDEQDPHVRRAILEYLGTVGGPRAFEAAVRRLDHDDASLRLHAQDALIRMTGARLAPEAGAWRAWRDAHDDWALPPEPDR